MKKTKFQDLSQSNQVWVLNEIFNSQEENGLQCASLDDLVSDIEFQPDDHYEFRLDNFENVYMLGK